MEAALVIYSLLVKMSFAQMDKAKQNICGGIHSETD